MDHTAHNRVGAGKALLGHQTVIDPFGRVRLLPEAFFLVLLQTAANKALNFRGDNARSTKILLPDTGHDCSLAILLYGRSGYAQPFCD